MLKYQFIHSLSEAVKKSMVVYRCFYWAAGFFASDAETQQCFRAFLWGSVAALMALMALHAIAHFLRSHWFITQYGFTWV